MGDHIRDVRRDGGLLRVLDANANRAREGLRIVEDYARFILNDDDLSGRLKNLRHELAGATKSWGAEAILYRDTPGDVGTKHTTPTEMSRENLAEIVTAAGKRLGEALRAIEEFAKTVSESSAGEIEAIRYRFYDIEQIVARTLRPAGIFEKVRLYVLITERACKRPWLEVAEHALAGGAACLQLREKEMESGELLRRAREFTALCRRYKAISIINDRPDIAVLSDADGVHVGQDDLPTIEARKIVGRDKIVGVSTHRIEQAKQAVLDGADYIGVGPVFPSLTKPREILPGLNYAREIAEKIAIPAVAIGGIDDKNVEEVLATGLRRVAITAAIAGCDDVRAVTERIKGKLIGSAL